MNLIDAVLRAKRNGVIRRSSWSADRVVLVRECEPHLITGYAMVLLEADRDSFGNFDASLNDKAAPDWHVVASSNEDFTQEAVPCSTG